MAEIAIVNASPLILLARSGHLQLLQRAAAEILVPDAVADEIRAHPDDEATEAVDATDWLKVVRTGRIPPVVLAWDLGPGESAVLACALARPGAGAIIDELAGRRCATALGVSVRGCLGLALTAKARGDILAAKPVVEDLRRAGLYLSDVVMQNALALVGE